MRKQNYIHPKGKTRQSPISKSRYFDDLVRACNKAGGHRFDMHMNIKCHDGWYLDDIHDFACVSHKCSTGDVRLLNHKVMSALVVGLQHEHGWCSGDLKVSHHHGPFLLVMVMLTVALVVMAVLLKRCTPSKEYQEVSTISIEKQCTNDIEMN